MREHQPTVHIGYTVGAFTLVAPLGAGGMGEVWRARDEKLGRDVALKVLPTEFAEDPERLARFEREARVLASLNHPNIAALYGLETAAGSPGPSEPLSDTGTGAGTEELTFLVMELVEGEGLDERIARGPVPLDEAVPIARQIAEALEAAHDAGIVHRDLKPANVMIRGDGTVKVLDFGLAKAWDAETGDTDLSLSPTLTRQATAAGVILGTAAYMSPEQARGTAVDHRSDIWSFGVVVWEMLTGRQLFDGGTVSDLIAAVLTQDVDPDALPATTPPAVRRLLRRALDRNPRNRLQAIGDARLELEEASEETPTAVAGSRPRSGIGPLGLAALALAALAVGWIAGRALRPAPGPSSPVRVQQLSYSGHDSQPSASPDGRLIAFTSVRDGVSRIWLRQIAGGGEQPLTEGSDVNPRFAPDGSSVVFARDEGGSWSIYRTALVGGQPRRLVEDATEAAWSPQGDRLAFLRTTRTSDGTQWGAQIGLFDPAVNQTRILLDLPNWVLYGVTWSPDGDRIAVTRAAPQGAGQGWAVLLLDPETGDTTELRGLDQGAAISCSTWVDGGRSLVFAMAADTVGDLTGAPARVGRYDLGSRTFEPLFWASGLFPFRGNDSDTGRFTDLGGGRLVFDTVRQQSGLRQVALGTGTHRTLTTSAAADRQPAFSPDGRTVVFSSNRSGNLDIWAMDVATGALSQLTDDAAQDWDPGFTPGGRHLLFSSDRGGPLEIWMANVDGSDARQVTSDGIDAENPTMTADGDWIVYSSGNPDHLGVFRIRPDGTDATRIAEGNYTNPEVSPDGRWALFVSSATTLESEVRVVEVATGEDSGFRIVIPTDPLSPNVTYGRGRWLPDGSAIVFVGLDDQGRTGLFAQDFVPGEDTSSTRRPFAGFFDDAVTESFGIAPDGDSATISVIQQTRSLQLAEGVATGSRR